MQKIINLFFILILLFFSNSAYSSCVGLGCNCTIASTALSFGTYNPITNTVLDATGTVSVTCSALVVGAFVSYTVSLSKGNSSTYSPRTLLSGANTLNYNLYTNASHTTIWGDGTSGTSTISDSYTLTILAPTTIPYTVYGEIAAAQTSARIGSYSDTITATVTY